MRSCIAPQTGRPRAPAARHRFRLDVSERPGRVRVCDHRTGQVLFDWHGTTARHLLGSGAIPADLRRPGSYRCGKPLVMHLALVATSIDVALDRAHAWVAGILHAYPERHLAEEDVISLALLESPASRPSRIIACLDNLVDWRLISRIVVDVDNVFYDINTEPHLHLFDPVKRELLDAPAAGVVRADASAVTFPTTASAGA